MNVDTKVALITGAARGQGRSHAVRLAHDGYDIIAVDVCRQLDTVPYPMGTAADLAGTVDQVRALGREIVAVQADVRDYDVLRVRVDEAVALLGGLDAVVVNAGIHSGGMASHEMPDELWDELISVNLTGAWTTCKAAVPHLITGGRGGSVVIISSTAGLRGYPTIAHYVAAKHALMGLTKTLAQELGGYSIRVNAVNPTQVDTDMIQNPLIWKLFSPELENPGRDDFAAASEQGMLLPTPWLEPSDVSDSVAFLCSDQARYITGIGLPVDAGVLAR